MKCTSCGAEIKDKSKFCEFCGSQITYDMQREQEQLNKAGCPKCGSSYVTFTREKQGELKSKNGTAVVRTTIGLCKDCGYTWSTTDGNQPLKKRKTWLWVLGWICIFPLPLTILMLRKKDMKPALKYGIIAVAWIVYLAIGLSGGSDNNSATNDNNSAIVSESNNTANNTDSTIADNNTNDQSQDVTSETDSEVEEKTDYALIDNFIDTFNINAVTPITDAEEIDIASGSEHYRTEYRLTPFRNAVAKQAKIGDATVDIIAYGSFSNDSLRVYVSTESEDFAVEVFTNIAKMMYPDVTSNDLDEAVKELRERDNGAYLDDLSFYYIHSYKELFMDNIKF